MLGFWLILFLIYGACIGSFLNVVIYRLPEEKSLWHPPSHCPKCNHQLAVWENIPVLAWCFLGAKCRKCKAPISFQYPLVELITALLFGGLYLALYHTELRLTAFVAPGLEQTWPVFALYLLLIAALLAATVIDARLYIIPISIPWTIALLALLAYPLAGHFYPHGTQAAGYVVGATGVKLALGGAAGLLLANVLLRWGVLPQSFADAMAWEDEQRQRYEAQQAGKADAEAQALPGAGAESEAQALPGAEGAVGEAGEANQDATADWSRPDAFLAYPHARREVMKELLFVLFPIAGMLLAWALSPWPGAEAGTPTWLGALCGSLLGLISGAAVVWATRILGTLAFRKEAMGLGDVHLMAGVGAVVGPIDPVLAFFIAPFIGLLVALASYGVARLARGSVRIIPYGPSLAVATLVVMVLREVILGRLRL